ncbi:MAG: hypothetical protein ACRET3_05455 [Burkholderiales bacterium]
MNDTARKLAQSQELSTKVAQLLQRRLKLAQERYTERVEAATKAHGTAAVPTTPWDMW